MRILALSYEFPPVGGGGGWSTHEIFTTLSKQGHIVDVVTMRLSELAKQSKITKNLTIYRVYSARSNTNRCSFFSALIYLITGWYQANKLVRKNNYDVIHATFIFPSGLIACLIAKRHGLPFIVTARGSDVPGHNQSLNKAFKFLKKPWLHVVQSATAVTTVSTYLAQLIQRETNRKITIIPNSVAINNFPPTNYGKTILIVGRLQRFKNVNQAIIAFARSKARDHGYRLVVVGDGPDKSNLKHFSFNKKIPVEFCGRLSRPDLIKLYQQSSILISASQFESFSRVLMEAMASGLAVIATDVGGCRELVGETGQLIPVGQIDKLVEAIDYYTDKPARIIQMGKKARLRVQQHYDTQTIVSCYERVLRSTRHSK
jgi:glycosyltransferase involved in cell wall biosynthesis